MTHRCRSCSSEKVVEFLDLGEMPIASMLVSQEDKQEGNFPKSYPLKVVFCENCMLVSLTENVDEKEIFIDNYNYFASFSPSILEHAETFADEIVSRLGLNHESFVVELGSNDGYQLQFFKRKSIPCLGFEPSPGPSEVAKNRKLETIQEFFGVEEAWKFLAEAHPQSRGRKADLIVANNVIGHVRDLNDLLEGVSLILKESGTATFESPWVKCLLDDTQFDTIYHEHGSYFSTHAIQNACDRHDLAVTDVQFIEGLHGGMLRWYVQHKGLHMVSPNVTEFLGQEVEAGLTTSTRFEEFGEQVRNLKDGIIDQIKTIQGLGKNLAAYGAVAKGATLTNYLGLTSDDISKVYDRNMNKAGSYLPGSLIPVDNADHLAIDAPDVVLILAWNFADEIISQQKQYLDNGGAFLVPVPHPKLVSASTLTDK